MKTVVETFVMDETANLVYDNEQLEKWNRLIGELGLSGQSQIAKPDKSPIPFMHMKTSLSNTFSELCPRKVYVEEFNITPIPVEILDLIALSKNEQYFNKIEIWYDDKSPDPVCVGITSQYYGYLGNKRTESYSSEQEVKDLGVEGYIYETNRQEYLIGKWGDVKRSFEELKEMAIKRFKASRENDLNASIKRYQRELDDLNTESFNRFN